MPDAEELATVWDEGYKRGAADWAAVNLKALEVAIAPNPYRTTEENPMSDGLHQKYNVQRVNDETGKHDDCRYFVLDPQHDRLALEALHFYSRIARESGYLALADDLLARVRQVEDDQR